MLLVLLRPGRKAHMDEQQRGVAPVPPERRAPAPAMPMPAAPERWRFQESMINRYGEVNATKIHEWWSQVGTEYLEGDAPLVMVSGLQLFLDFFQTTGYEGPWLHKKKWYSVEEMAPAAGREPWGHRVKSFLSLWKTYLKKHQLKIPTKVVRLARPNSVSISRWVVCYRLRLPDNNAIRSSSSTPTFSSSLAVKRPALLTLGKSIRQ